MALKLDEILNLKKFYIFFKKGLSKWKLVVFLHPTLSKGQPNKEITEVKEYYNEQKNISAIEKKKKKQTRF